MAEIQSSENRNKRGGIRSKKLSTRVDLTPMVDLGFLLITFFIFTTTMNQPTVMKLVVPDDRLSDNTAPESKTISFILEADNRIRYYNGLDISSIRQTDYSPSGLRTVIQQKMNSISQKSGKAGDIIVLIKPTDGASYKNVVDILDEMQINDVTKYVLMDPGKEEVGFL